MSDVKLTVAQVAKQIGETVHVLRNWVSDFRSYIPLEKSESGYNLFTQESINVIKRIQKYSREQKLTTRQIEAILSGAEKPVVMEEEEREALAKNLSEIKDLLAQQQEFNAALVQRLDEQNKRIEQSIQRRDDQLMLALRQIQEVKRPKTLQDKPWWKLW